MNLIILVLTAPFFLMLLLGLVPNSQANRSRLTIRKLVMSLVGTACLVALGSAAMLLGGLLQPFYVPVIKASWSQHWELSFYYDNVTALMLCLVSLRGGTLNGWLSPSEQFP
jgi:NADH:ubiquinone oxidoreductase subunit 5 (subunit L)/multisubunit Na+/H+ antiporter MnhA subunit